MRRRGLTTGQRIPTPNMQMLVALTALVLLLGLSSPAWAVNEPGRCFGYDGIANELFTSDAAQQVSDYLNICQYWGSAYTNKSCKAEYSKFSSAAIWYSAYHGNPGVIRTSHTAGGQVVHQYIAANPNG